VTNYSRLLALEFQYDLKGVAVKTHMGRLVAMFAGDHSLLVAKNCKGMPGLMNAKPLQPDDDGVDVAPCRMQAVSFGLGSLNMETGKRAFCLYGCPPHGQWCIWTMGWFVAFFCLWISAVLLSIYYWVGLFPRLGFYVWILLDNCFIYGVAREGKRPGIAIPPFCLMVWIIALHGCGCCF